MYTVDVPKVKGKMGEKGYNISSLSRKINVNRNTLTNYFNNPGAIPYEKLSAMASLLCDDSAECAKIFFAQKLT